MELSFAVSFPLMLIIVFGSIAFTVQRKQKRDDDDLPPTGGVMA
jgi:hypothetical protein